MTHPMRLRNPSTKGPPTVRVQNLNAAQRARVLRAYVALGVVSIGEEGARGGANRFGPGVTPRAGSEGAGRAS